MGKPARRPHRPFTPDVGQLVILAVVSWLVALWNLSAPGLVDRTGQLKGTDFVQFYLQGYVAHSGDWPRLYDPPAMAELSRSVVPEAPSDGYPTVYGPQVALFFAPFATLPYGVAYVTWLAVSALLLALAARASWAYSPYLAGAGRLVAVAVAGAPATINLALFGQSSAVAAAAVTAAGVAHVAGRPWLTGLALGVLVYKPQLAAAAGVLFLCTRQWRVVAGMAIGGAAVLAAAWVGAGSSTMLEYLRFLPKVAAARDALMPKPYHMQSLQAFASLLLPAPLSGILGWGAAFLVWAATVRAWRRLDDPRWQWSTLLVATVLTADHAHIYDLVILLPAFVWTVDWLAANPDDRRAAALRAAVGAAYVLPLLNPLAAATHVQVSVLALAAWFVLALDGPPVTSATVVATLQIAES